MSMNELSKDIRNDIIASLVYAIIDGKSIQDASVTLGSLWPDGDVKPIVEETNPEYFAITFVVDEPSVWSKQLMDGLIEELKLARKWCGLEVARISIAESKLVFTPQESA